MRYQIVSEQSIEKLEDSVSALLETGWQPQGGITCHDYDFYQVLTHPEDNITPLEIKQIQSEFAERLAQVNPVFAIPEQELTEQQRAERQEFWATLVKSFREATKDSKSEKDSD